MGSAFKPDGYPTASPYLVVSDASKTIDFLEAALDGEEIRRFAADDGRIMHAEVRIDDSVIMLGEGGEGWPAIGSFVHVYVADVDASYARALAQGGTSVQEPVKRDDADKRGGVKDPGGTTWWLATKVD
jgi:PhnB protein